MGHDAFLRPSIAACQQQHEAASSMRHARTDHRCLSNRVESTNPAEGATLLCLPIGLSACRTLDCPETLKNTMLQVPPIAVRNQGPAPNVPVMRGGVW